MMNDERIMADVVEDWRAEWVEAEGTSKWLRRQNQALTVLVLLIESWPHVCSTPVRT